MTINNELYSEKYHEHAEHANRAADYIEENGWCQNNWRTQEGKVCLFGAIRLTAETLELYSPLENFLTEVLASETFSGPAWNDYKGRTKEEVVGLLRGKYVGELIPKGLRGPNLVLLDEGTGWTDVGYIKLDETLPDWLSQSIDLPITTKTWIDVTD